MHKDIFFDSSLTFELNVIGYKTKGECDTERLLNEVDMRIKNECKAIMGFPRDFKVPVSRTQMFHQFGNSVVVPVIAAIAKNVVKDLKLD